MLTASQRERLDKIKVNLEKYAELKKKTFGTPKGWKRSGRMENGYTLLAGDVIICEFGDPWTRGEVEETALNFIVNAHNCGIEDDLAYLINLVDAPKAVKNGV